METYSCGPFGDSENESHFEADIYAEQVLTVFLNSKQVFN